MTFETKTIWPYKSSIFHDNKMKPIIPVYKTRFTIKQQINVRISSMSNCTNTLWGSLGLEWSA